MPFTSVASLSVNTTSDHANSRRRGIDRASRKPRELLLPLLDPPLEPPPEPELALVLKALETPLVLARARSSNSRNSNRRSRSRACASAYHPRVSGETRASCCFA